MRFPAAFFLSAQAVALDQKNERSSRVIWQSTSDIYSGHGTLNDATKIAQQPIRKRLETIKKLYLWAMTSPASWRCAHLQLSPDELRRASWWQDGSLLAFPIIHWKEMILGFVLHKLATWEKGEIFLCKNRSSYPQRFPIKYQMCFSVLRAGG